MADKDFKVKSGLSLGTPLPVSMGGTGQTSTTNTLNSLLPSQAGNSSKVLQTDGTNTTWVTLPNGYSIGNTASRPGSPTLGQIYSNTQTGYIEVYTAQGWSQLGVIPLTPSTPTAADVGTNVAYGSGAVDVTFTPASGGGLASTFTATSTPSSITGANSTSPVRVTGLTTGTSYTFTIIATNGYGNATATSPSNSVTVTSVPQAPTVGSPSSPTGQSFASTANISVPFTANATGGKAITSYTATSSPGGITGTSASSPITVSGLTRETAYTFTVTGTNANGTSLSSSASSSATPTTVPQTMSAPTATNSPSGRAFNNGLASVAFTTPATGGQTITGYTVTSSPGGFIGTGSTSPITVAGLQSNTAYTFTATATNSNGTSIASAASNSITATTVPQAPTIGTATASGLTASVTFTAPASNGGSTITGYTVTSSPGNITGTGSTSPITVSGLTDSQAYTFTVTATNANGTSAASAASNSITPISYNISSFGSYYPYNIASRTGGWAVQGYSSGPGVGNAFVSGGGTVVTNGNVYTSLSNAGAPQGNSYGFDSSGNIYWVAQGASNDFYIISQDSSRNIRWQMRYTNGIYAGYLGISGLHVGKDNQLYIWGNYAPYAGDTFGFAQKLNSANGNTVWGRTFPSSITPVRSMSANANGDCVIFYTTFGMLGLNSSGTQIFRKESGTSSSGTRGATSDSAGNFILSSSTSNTPVIYKMDNTGTFSWARTISYPVTGYGADWGSGRTTITTDASNNIYVIHNGNTPEACVVKFDTNGNTLFKRRLSVVNQGSGGGQYPYSISADSANNIMYIAGQTIFGSPYGNIGWTYKLPADGTKTGTYDIVGNGSTHVYADSSSLTVGSSTLTFANNSYGTISTGTAASGSTSSLTFTTTSNFNGATATVTTI